MSKRLKGRWQTHQHKLISEQYPPGTNPPQGSVWLVCSSYGETCCSIFVTQEQWQEYTLPTNRAIQP